MKQIGVKYCGGCNPQINRAKIVQEVGQRLPENYRLVNGPPQREWEAAILVCGCPVACADRLETRKLARRWILVSGPMVDLFPVPVDQVASVIASKILRSEFLQG